MKDKNGIPELPELGAIDWKRLVEGDCVETQPPLIATEAELLQRAEDAMKLLITTQDARQN